MPTKLDFSAPHVLRTDDEYESASSEIDALLDLEVEANTPQGERLLFLSVLVEAYERDRFPVADRLAGCTPQTAVDFMLTHKGRSRADLEPCLGSKSRVSEFFSGKRPLSKAQILALRDLLGIPADLLITA